MPNARGSISPTTASEPTTTEFLPKETTWPGGALHRAIFLSPSSPRRPPPKPPARREAAYPDPSLTGTLDVFWTAQNYHDLHNSLPPDGVIGFNKALRGLVRGWQRDV